MQDFHIQHCSEIAMKGKVFKLFLWRQQEKIPGRIRPSLAQRIIWGGLHLQHISVKCVTFP